ncbi:hypothetical protein ACFXBB_37990, partial [Streptomyces scopuliridis]|uniref:hypothetical protein n=2 Tax=Streptomyces scopuliridis TaxID=452529 RepID=UPI0036D0FA80
AKESAGRSRGFPHVTLIFEVPFTDGGRPYKNQTVSTVRADTPNGPMNVVAASGDGLTAAQQASLRSGEVAAVNDSNLHAETNAMQHIANQPGWSLAEGGASRNMCPYCENTIRDNGGRLTGPAQWKQRVNFMLNGVKKFNFRFGQRSFEF